MWEKIERYSSYCMVLGTVLFIATIGAAVGCVLGFTLCQRLGLDGTLQDFFVFAFGLLGFVVTCYYVKRVISWFEIIAGTLFFMLILFSLVGQIYIYEFSDRNAVLMQSASVFNELDELSFMVALAAAAVFLYFCVLIEYRRWSRNKKRNSVIEKS